MAELGINFDEISDDLDVAIGVMKDNGVLNGELRTVNGKNIIFWTDKEALAIKRQIDEAGIKLIAAATPLFKWYISPDDPEIPHDSFGFNPRLNEVEKKAAILRMVQIAKLMGIPRLRIFSGLGEVPDAGSLFANDPMLKFALDEADKASIDLYLENEPVCRVYKKQDIIDLLEHNVHPRLKFWLDVANLTEVGETIDKGFINQVLSRLGYLHVKDYRTDNGGKRYVPVGQGEVGYDEVMKLILGATGDIMVTVETHARPGDKIESSVASIKATRELIAKYEAQR